MSQVDYICMECGNEFGYNPEKQKCPNCDSTDIALITDNE